MGKPGRTHVGGRSNYITSQSVCQGVFENFLIFFLHPLQSARDEVGTARSRVNGDLVGEGREACFTPSEGSRQRFGEGGEIFPISLEGGATAPSNYVLNNHRSIPPCFTVIIIPQENTFVNTFLGFFLIFFKLFYFHNLIC